MGNTIDFENGFNMQTFADLLENGKISNEDKKKLTKCIMSEDSEENIQNFIETINKIFGKSDFLTKDIINNVIEGREIDND